MERRGICSSGSNAYKSGSKYFSFRKFLHSYESISMWFQYLNVVKFQIFMFSDCSQLCTGIANRTTEIISQMFNVSESN